MGANEIVRSRRLFWVALAALLLAALACNMGEVFQEDGYQVPAGEHVPYEQTQAEIQATQEAYFTDFDGPQVYSGNTNFSQENQARCDFGFPQGQNIEFEQAYTPGSADTPYGLDQVTVAVDGFMQTYDATGPNSYEFCRRVKTETDENGTEIAYRECLMFKENGFEVRSYYLEDPDNADWEEGWVQCYSDVFTEAQAQAPNNADPDGNFDGSWNSGPVCSESETPYSWQVSLIQDGDSVIGSVHFHKCPGGGQVGYSVTGTVVPGQAYIDLQGTKAGGAGDLYSSSPETQSFTFFPDSPPLPNFGE